MKDPVQEIKILTSVLALVSWAYACNTIFAQTDFSSSGGSMYAGCLDARPVSCGENTIKFNNPHLDGGTDVWYSFNSSATVTTTIYFTSNTAEIYNVAIFGPFSSTDMGLVCSDRVMFNAQWPNRGKYWDFFSQTTNYTTSLITFQPGFYILQARYENYYREPAPPQAIFTVNLNCNPVDSFQLPCTDCIGSFAPDAGEYILSAWVKEEIYNPNQMTYTNPRIYIDFPSTNAPSSGLPALGPFLAENEIIDEWQRIENEFTVPASASYINIKLECASGNCFFDDIRIFPKDGSMKSYVYDPLNLRLVAELDERNYATLYEYDEEGKLIRVKKETAKGVMTIKENKNSSVKVQ